MFRETAWTLSFLGLLSSTAQANVSPRWSERYQVPAPPAPHSAEANEELRLLHEYQNKRTSIECQIADAERGMKLETLFGEHTGVLNKLEMSKVHSQIHGLIFYTIRITAKFKSHYARLRPYVEDSEIHPCVPKPFHGAKRSYPSSYSSVAAALGDLIVKIYPEKKGLVEAQIHQISLNRVLGGVHHPSDVAAGESLGHQIATDYLNR